MSHGSGQLKSLDADLSRDLGGCLGGTEGGGGVEEKSTENHQHGNNYSTCWGRGSASFYNVASRSLGCDTVGRGLAQHESLNSVSSTS